MLPRSRMTNRQNRWFSRAKVLPKYIHVHRVFILRHSSPFSPSILSLYRDFLELKWRPSISPRTEILLPFRQFPPLTIPDRHWSLSAPVVLAPSRPQCAWSSPPSLHVPSALRHYPSGRRKTLITGNRPLLVLRIFYFPWCPYLPLWWNIIKW